MADGHEAGPTAEETAFKAVRVTLEQDEVAGVDGAFEVKDALDEKPAETWWQQYRRLRSA